ncbi:MAG: Primosomal protein N [Parcubacteria group bacterium GW2011_GWC2_42_6]|nr:MAG: Primosomal protein N [Parcubacteria group bacterium GW2011_GWC2_42_6]
MFIIDILPLTKTPHTQPQILSYFYSSNLTIGTLVEIPLGRRKEYGIVLDSHPAADFRQEIKKAAYELKSISRLIFAEPILTPQQIQLTLFLGQYYFTSPGMFLKMTQSVIMRPKIEGSIARRTMRAPKSQKLILFPTISQANIFYSSHKPNAVIWHSDLTKKKQKEIWQQIKNAEIQTIIGTRSAIFLPFINLKEIIVEDATNPSHRSWDMRPHYSAIIAAQKLTEIFKAKLTLNSDIPTISIPISLLSFKEKKGELLPAQIIDFRAEMKAGNFSIFSRALQTAIKDALRRQQPIILFINRRGAANFVLCRDCGYIAKCANCDAPLAHHLINQKPRLLCHRCGAQTEPPSICPECRSDRVKTVGIGSQKVELEAQKLFSAAKIARLDSDAAPKAKDQQKIIQNYIESKTDILIATQILFSYKTEITQRPPAVIGVISADTLLHLPDYQSGERTWQIIAMLKKIQNNIIIQTHNPENSIIQSAAAGNWQSFYDDETETRKLLNYPPFSQIIKLTFRHRDPKRAGQEAKILAAKLKRINPNTPTSSPSLKKGEIRQPAERGCYGAILSDPLPAFIPKQKGKYVWNIIIKFPISNFQFPINKEFFLKRDSLLQYIPANWEISIDPLDLL